MRKRDQGDTKSSVRKAMRALADENRAFLQDISLSIPYSDYREIAKLQEFEATLYLVMSDLYEHVGELERVHMTRHWAKPLPEMRESSLYATLQEEVKRTAADLAHEEDVDGKEWIRAKRGLARKKIVRTLQEGRGRKALEAAAEIVDRDMPKQPRNGHVGSSLVIVTPESAALIEKAMKVVGPKETKLIGPGS